MAARSGIWAKRDLAGYAHITPSVDTAWIEAFVLEQRLLDVPGERIGDSLAVVESHVAETGEPATEAFSDPTKYARADAPEETTRVPFDSLWVAGIFCGLVGLLVTSLSAQAWFSGSAGLDLTVGIALLVLGTALMALSAATGRTTDDPITAPGETPSRRAGWMTVAVFPLMTAVVTGASWVI